MNMCNSILSESCAVIVTSLSEEYKAVRNHLAELEEVIHKGTVYELGNFSCSNGSWMVYICEIGPGNPIASLEVERAIQRFNPHIVLFVGVAGGLKDVNLFDVVAATKVYGYEFGKAKSEFKQRPEVVNSTYSLVQRARADAKKEDWLKRLSGVDIARTPKVFVGPIAAGEKVVADKLSSVYGFIKENYSDALAVDMEGYGFLKSSQINKVDAIVIRGISDLIDNKEDADAAGSQEIAAQNASAFGFEILANITPRIYPEKLDTSEYLRIIKSFLRQYRKKSDDLDYTILDNLIKKVHENITSEAVRLEFGKDGEWFQISNDICKANYVQMKRMRILVANKSIDNFESVIMDCCSRGISFLLTIAKIIDKMYENKPEEIIPPNPHGILLNEVIRELASCHACYNNLVKSDIEGWVPDTFAKIDELHSKYAKEVLIFEKYKGILNLPRSTEEHIKYIKNIE